MTGTKISFINENGSVRIIDDSDITKFINKIKKHIECLENENESLKKQLTEYDCEVANDEKIKELKKYLDWYRKHSVDIMSDRELESWKNFRNKHYKSCKGNTKLIISGTGIGSVFECQCDKCGEIEDITDISNW